MNLIDGGVVTDVDFDGEIGFATIDLNGRNLYVEFPVSYVDKTTCISSTPFDPQMYEEWDVDVECPVIAGDVVLCTWQGSADDFTEGKILLDGAVLKEIGRLLEVRAAEMVLEGDCDE